MPQVAGHSGDSGGMDYSDFSYQHFSINIAEDGGNSGASEFEAGVDPLEDSNGLDSNEVAELVAMRLHVSVSTDNFGSVADTAEGNVQMRGIVAIDPDFGDTLERDSYLLTQGTKIRDADGGDGELKFFSHDKDNVLHPFQCHVNAPFSSDAGGVGGSGGFDVDYTEINFRELVGRGPVVDSNDNFGVALRITKNQVAARAEGSIRGTLVWDISSVDDAGRRFSVPSDD